MELKIDVKQAVTDLRQQFAGMEQRSFNRAVAMGLNEALARAQAAGNKMISARYSLKAAAIDRKKVIKVNKANGNRLATSILVSMQHVPLIAFTGVNFGGIQAKVTKGGTSLRKKVKGKWVSISSPTQNTGGGVNLSIIKGQDKNIPFAFLQIMPNGHIGVFARGFKGDMAYSNGRFNKRTFRLNNGGNDSPIKELATMSFHSQWVNKVIQPKLAEVANANVSASILRAIKLQLSK